MGNKLSFKKEFGLILVGATIFTASFLWKDFLTDVEEKYFPKNHGLGGRFFFVVIVTIILIAIAVHMKGMFGLANSSKNAIKFDDSPVDDSPLEYDSIDDYIGANGFGTESFKNDDNNKKPR